MPLLEAFRVPRSIDLTLARGGFEVRGQVEEITGGVVSGALVTIMGSIQGRSIPLSPP
ncbi:hypothetical protein WMF38_25780 [Sorangium sp. So ce118]